MIPICFLKSTNLRLCHQMFSIRSLTICWSAILSHNLKPTATCVKCMTQLRGRLYEFFFSEQITKTPKMTYTCLQGRFSWFIPEAVQSIVFPHKTDRVLESTLLSVTKENFPNLKKVCFWTDGIFPMNDIKRDINE